MKCPVCGSGNTLIHNTRQHGEIRRRTYLCECGVKFKTVEQVVESWKSIPLCDACGYKKLADAKCESCALAKAAQEWSETFGNE